MTDPKVAALAADLGVGLGSDLEAQMQSGAPGTALVLREPDELAEMAPTSHDFREAMRKLGWKAVYICGPAHAVPTRWDGVELWPVCVGTTVSPRNVKLLAQAWSWVDVAVHGLVWGESEAAAERLSQMLIDALDFRRHHLGHRFYNLPPLDCTRLLIEVAKLARIPVHEEAERLQRLASIAGEKRRRLEAKAGAVQRIGRRR
jgi:hypothetical protein